MVDRGVGSLRHADPAFDPWGKGRYLYGSVDRYPHPLTTESGTAGALLDQPDIRQKNRPHILARTPRYRFHCFHRT